MTAADTPALSIEQHAEGLAAAHRLIEAWPELPTGMPEADDAVMCARALLAADSRVRELTETALTAEEADDILGVIDGRYSIVENPDLSAKLRAIAALLPPEEG